MDVEVPVKRDLDWDDAALWLTSYFTTRIRSDPLTAQHITRSRSRDVEAGRARRH